MENFEVNQRLCHCLNRVQDLAWLQNLLVLEDSSLPGDTPIKKLTEGVT